MAKLEKGYGSNFFLDALLFQIRKSQNKPLYFKVYCGGITSLHLTHTRALLNY